MRNEMKNLVVIQKDLDVSTLLTELEASEDLWNVHKGRTAPKGGAHAEICDIWLRFNDHREFASLDHNLMSEEHESLWYEAIDSLPLVKAAIYGILASLQGEQLGGVILTRLPPKGTIAPHVDEDWHSHHYKKYHLLLQGEGSLIYSGNEYLVPSVGELFYLNDKEIHGVINNSDEHRICLVVCVKKDNNFRVGA